jgi:phospho-N-acetylmuramoyl-pentapeptide-transferase
VEGTAPSAFFDAQTLYSVAIASFVVSALVFPWYIKWLKKKQVEQYIREEGPQSHAAKAKTPTMGGLCFIAVSTVISLAFLILYWSMQGASHGVVSAIAVVITAMLCGLVGFADDFAKVTSKSNTGLSARARLLIEFVLGGLLGIALVMTNSPGINIGSILGIRLDPIWNAVYAFTVIPFLVAATTNAMNLHDGMDGLAGGTSIQVFLVLAIMLAFSGQILLAVVAASLVGAVGGFLIYNRNPAKVFMGDTGSLYLGGALASLVAASGLILWFIPLALIYIIETVSVMIQVVYFKLTKDYTPETPMSKPALLWLKLTKRLPGEGKRFFRMAPLHHHFEAVGEDKGVPEWQVVAYFWLAQLAICAAVLFGYWKLTVR